MYPLLETIRLEGNRFWNLKLHSQRMRDSRAKLFEVDEPVRLESCLEVPSGIGAGKYKCRLPYGRSIGAAEYSPYTPLPITNLVVVASTPFDYSCKWSDRSRLDALKNRGGNILRETRSGIIEASGTGSRDVNRGSYDIIIAIAGRITDTTYSNIAFRDRDRWVTPARPLLEGTKRRELLELGLLREADISVDDIRSFTSATLINAMLDLGEIEISIESIVYDPSVAE